MLLIAEIWLTVSVWRSGWGAKALLPWVALVVVALFTGLAVGAAGGSPPSAAIFLPLDFALIAVLFAMKRTAPGVPTVEAPPSDEGLIALPAATAVTE